tara:strand:+ start:1743 stop:2120 length:378 start_codon:yes stop_codon:yes gene_type:complete
MKEMRARMRVPRVRSFVRSSDDLRTSAWYSNVSSFAATARTVARPRRLDVTAATRDDDVIDVVRPLRILVRVVGAVIGAIIGAVTMAAVIVRVVVARRARVVVSLPLVVVVSLKSSSRAAGRPPP